MTSEQAKYLIQILKEWGVYFQEGLTEDEFKLIHEKFDVEFPPDLKLFLTLGLPVTSSFINWRHGLTVESIANDIQKTLGWPFDGILYDIRENAFWQDSWGEKPSRYEKQVEVALHHFNTYPKLVPVYGHRYIPSFPNQIGNPVFSIYQTDIIYYGNDLASYFANEFNFTLPEFFFDIAKTPKQITFWSKLADE